jgi:hypothetical protein
MEFYQPHTEFYCGVDLHTDRAQDPKGVLGRFCASWPRFSKKIPSKSLIT